MIDTILYNKYISQMEQSGRYFNIEKVNSNNFFKDATNDVTLTFSINLNDKKHQCGVRCDCILLSNKLKNHDRNYTCKMKIVLGSDIAEVEFQETVYPNNMNLTNLLDALLVTVKNFKINGDLA